MTRFDKIKYDASTKLLQVGAGCLWGAVYRKTSKLGRGVVGGLSPGVGVAGFILGGGYSLKSSRLGLSIDTVKAFRIVLPTGEVRDVDDESTGENKELFNALRGGANQFGIVTRFTLYTHDQTSTYGALLSIPGKREADVKKAIMDHITNEKRNTAVIEVLFKYNLLPGKTAPEHTIFAICVFDAPKPKDESQVPFATFRKIVQDSWGENPVGWDPVYVAGDAHHFVAPKAPVSKEDVERSNDLGFREMPFRELHLLSEHTYDVASFHELVPIDLEESDDHPTLSKTGTLFEEVGCPGSNLNLGLFEPLVAPLQLQSTTNAVPQGASRASRAQPAKSLANLGETNLRGRFACVMVSTYTQKLVDEVASQAKKASLSMVEHGGRQVLIEVWPFHASIFDKSVPDAAWPHKKDDPYSPLVASFLWENAKDDAFWLKQIDESLNAILKVARDEGCAKDEMPRYLNTSLETVPVERIYGGEAQVKKLGKIRARYDPEDVMSLTGGFKIPLNKE